MQDPEEDETEKNEDRKLTKVIMFGQTKYSPKLHLNTPPTRPKPRPMPYSISRTITLSNTIVVESRVQCQSQLAIGLCSHKCDGNMMRACCVFCSSTSRHGLTVSKQAYSNHWHQFIVQYFLIQHFLIYLDRMIHFGVSDTATPSPWSLCLGSFF